VRGIESAHVDFAAVMERMRRLRASIAPHDSAPRFRELGVDVYLGDARYTAGDQLAVNGQTLHFRKAAICTGARAALSPIPGLADVQPLTNETIFSLTDLPRRLAVIGAGPIGCELAQAFARFGSQVCLFETEHGVLPREERDCAEIVRSSLAADGVTLLCCARNLAVTRSADVLSVQADSHDRRHEIAVDRILVAAGRVPNIEGLGLEAAGVEFDAKRGVRVNDRLQTTNPRIYAAGDICSEFKFTHAADFMARIVIQNALFLGRKKLSRLTIPWCTYTSPELARVGLSAAEAEKQGIAIDSFTQPLDRVDRSILDGDTDGLVRVHVRRGSDRIVGATIVAPHAGDLISEIAGAMTHRLKLSQLANVIHPYPTVAEAVRKTGDLYNRTRLTPLVQSLFRRWLALQR
jgi:pyruvate/2-oxoglutarate dehydrogenase complex dihydrolipoamide dehydrogenase (E3) component